MKINLLTSLLALGVLVLAAVTATNQSSPAQSTTIYSCNTTRNNIPTTVAYTEGKQISLIRWEKEGNSKYTAEDRCRIVSARFQKAYEKGVLKFITGGVMNGERVVCAASDYGAPCSQLLFTLEGNEDADAIIERLMGLGFRAEGPISQKADGSIQHYYDMKQLLRIRLAEVEEKNK
jgi:uncharacterized membrane protein